MLHLPSMLMIGACGRNVGKTELACAVIRGVSSRHPAVGVKVTTVRDRDAGCPRGGRGCGVCSSVEGHFSLSEETGGPAGKDTVRMLAAGASRVFWLRVLADHMAEGLAALLNCAGPDAVTVCESNSLRQLVVPGLFLMVRDSRSDRVKPSARSVLREADRLVSFDGVRLDLDPACVRFDGGRWSLCSSPATEALAAESRSSGER